MSHLRLSSDDAYFRQTYRLTDALSACQNKVKEVRKAIKKGRGALKKRLEIEEIRLEMLQQIKLQREQDEKDRTG